MTRFKNIGKSAFRFEHVAPADSSTVSRFTTYVKTGSDKVQPRLGGPEITLTGAALAYVSRVR